MTDDSRENVKKGASGQQILEISFIEQSASWKAHGIEEEELRGPNPTDIGC